MANNDVQRLLKYIDHLEKELKSSDPKKFQDLIRKRQDLLPLLQEQRALIETLRTEHLSDQAKIGTLQVEIDALRSDMKVAKLESEDRSDADRK